MSLKDCVVVGGLDMQQQVSIDVNAAAGLGGLPRRGICATAMQTQTQIPALYRPHMPQSELLTIAVRSPGQGALARAATTALIAPTQPAV